MIDYLILGAHPDDAELFCGGSILNWTKAGKSVVIADMTLGEMGSNGTVELRQFEAENAAKILGVKKRINLELPDGGLEDNNEQRLKLVRLYRDLKPKIVIAPCPDCRHPDHVALHYLAKNAHFQSGMKKLDTAQQPYRPKQLLFHPEFHPNPKVDFVVDISETIETKFQAIAAYSSQFFVKGEKDKGTFIGSEKFLIHQKGQAAYWGSLGGCLYAEAYQLYQGIPQINNPSDQLGL
ncbi:MAG: bacillithiol biosynthesis deacetylase BshB1 [Lentisphaeria bacterium]|nr:bacillithiol biosynthesis deacetylase BshB1 [Lentisphaeria bacterium]